jgi:hypothetical protein
MGLGHIRFRADALAWAALAARSLGAKVNFYGAKVNFYPSIVGPAVGRPRQSDVTRQ